MAEAGARREAGAARSRFWRRGKWMGDKHNCRVGIGRPKALGTSLRSSELKQVAKERARSAASAACTHKSHNAGARNARFFNCMSADR